MPLSFLDVKRADTNYKFLYGDLYGLMEKAGYRVAETVRKEFGSGRRILVVCGSGNNGGDGFVAARILSDSNDVKVWAVSGKRGMKTQESKKAAGEYKGRVLSPNSVGKAIESSDLIIDALLGSGLSGEPREPYASIINSLNELKKPVVSVDIPSGMGTKVQVMPKFTVTFTDSKEAMTRSNSGQIVVADIGIPDKAFTHNGPGDFVYYSLPGKGSHKGMNGSVALVAGWSFHGSAVIASLGAIRAGADLVRIYARHENREILSSYSPDIIVRDAEDATVIQEIRNSDTILLGPGLGKGQDLGTSVKALHGYAGTIVLDAEGLDHIAAIRKAAPSASVILTPHRGEFQRISGKEPNEENTIEFARKHKCTVILKGPVDLVTDGSEKKYTEGGNPRMTMGGTGDLLAGITAAVSTRVHSPLHAACLGSFINKMAGDLAFRKKSYWYTINEMVCEIPEVMKMSLGIARTQ